MKKCYFFLLFVFILGLSSCYYNPSPSYKLYSNAIDLKKYSQEGFFISTGEYYKEYDPVGMVEANSQSGYVKVEKKGKKVRTGDDDVYFSAKANPSASGYSYKDSNVEEAIQELVKQAKSLGADGVIQLKFSLSFLVITGRNHPYVYVSGMAIKRK